MAVRASAREFAGIITCRASQKLLRKRCTKRVHVTYALTELGPLAVATPTELARDPTCAGTPNPWVRLEVVVARVSAARMA